MPTIKTWSDTTYDRPTPPEGWKRGRVYAAWMLVGIERPHGQTGPKLWQFELRTPEVDEYSHEWLMSAGAL